MIVAEQISKTYKDNTGSMLSVFADVDFSAARGQVTLIMGPSGSGKSTLLDMLGLISPVEQGSLTILDQEVTTYSEKKRCDYRLKNIGYIFQAFNLIDDFTILDNCAIPIVLSGSSWKDARKQASQTLEELIPNINHQKYPQEISGGQQQRVAIARAIIHNPNVIIADEPTGNLDDTNKQAVMEKLRDITKQFNTTTVVVSHDNDFIAYSDKLYRFVQSAGNNQLIIQTNR